MEKVRLLKLREAMVEQKLDAVFITNAFNRKYLSGFTGSSGYLIITLNQAILLTDFRYMTQAPAQAHYYEVIEHGPKAIETVKEILTKYAITQVGFEQNEVTYGLHQSYAAVLNPIKLVPTDQLVEKLRMFKDSAELIIMQEAADLADQTFSYILTKLKSGVSEKEIALDMEIYMRKHGATSSSFDTIVASGERSALPHGVASDRILQTNEFVKLDFGAYYNGYCSDLTRTVVLGKPTDKHKEIYDIVLEAQLQTLDKLKPGMTGREADAVARDIIRKAGYGDHFGHGTGHGLGMEIHEAPRLSFQSDVVLEAGMVVTVEPGIYIPGFGGVRIEDDVVLTENGIRILTHSSKDFIVID
ncbi:aminopeptidase P family protein [Paenibacillus psychroresistens]|uniref:Aminopeptidase P family protein n=1 Tax=Paenibacillus psychroresistens TaxID=1778678 RepID=A0A6B8RL50_9BACL|nr:Xaa-Pro peptidase family protein [Paenibacillus psychroresistens]QGQ97121.1 aminopeptidase P family protein [Paenibacillus psychroresistens]